MRITTQMINESAMKSGLPIHQTTLLDYINTDSSTTTTSNSLLNALNSATDSKQKNSYEQLEKSADALENSASILASEEEDSLFEEARQSGSTESVKKQAKELLSNYNDMLKKLTSSDSTLNQYYRQMLQQAYSENKDTLSEIGISAGKNGYLSLDESTFDAADIDTLEQALGSDSVFTIKTGFIASHVADNAETSIESMSSQYSAAGQQLFSYTGSKYDLWG
jgi:hypothetical protein